MLIDTAGQFMKELDIFAGYAIIKQHKREVLPITKGHCMMESNIHASNAAIKQPQKEDLLNTKGQYT